MKLTPIENTAWLTVYCRYLESRKPGAYLKDKVAEWLMEQMGDHGFAHKIRKSVRMGVPARSAAIDRLVKEELERAAKEHFSWVYVAIGCGLDARWERLSARMAGTVDQYYEVDYQNLLDYKKEIIDNSPYRDLYAQVKRVAGDLREGLPAGLPSTPLPALVVIEGCVMYLKQEEQLLLLRDIRERLPNATVILDTYNAHAAGVANKRSARSTGSEQLGFTPAPENPVHFYRSDNWKIHSAVSLIKEMFSANRSLLRYVPLPPRISKLYLLIKMS